MEYPHVSTPAHHWVTVMEVLKALCNLQQPPYSILTRGKNKAKYLNATHLVTPHLVGNCFPGPHDLSISVHDDHFANDDDSHLGAVQVLPSVLHLAADKGLERTAIDVLLVPAGCASTDRCEAGGPCPTESCFIGEWRSDPHP